MVARSEVGFSMNNALYMSLGIDAILNAMLNIYRRYLECMF
jgi:hypothetical protein